MPDPRPDRPTDASPGRSVRARRRTEDEHLLAAPPQEQVVFTETDPWRVLRIMGEFVEGFDALAGLPRAVTIFGSARSRPPDPMLDAAAEVARQLGREGFAIVTGGGPGIMEAANRGAREVGAISVGLNIELPFEQMLNPYLDVAVDFRYFFVRKTMLVKYAQAFVIFPGGFGTLDEFLESLTLIQTGKVRNFPVLLYGSDYWRGLLDWLQGRVLAEGKIAPADLDLFHLCDTPEQVVKWIRDSVVHGEPSRIVKEERAREETRRAYEPAGDA